MDPDRARALAERLHGGEPDAGGAPLIDHVRRVAAAVPGDARVVAWLHEVFEYTSISEEALLAEGLSLDELRALRLLTHNKDSRSNASYLAQVELIARAKGAGASIARSVKGADLADRALNPSIRANGWSPPYELALQILRGAPPSDTFAPSPPPPLRPGRNMTPVTDGAHKAPSGVGGQPSESGRQKPRLGRRARHPVAPEDEPELPRTEPEVHAERLGFALRSLAAELVEERQKVAELRREVAELRARLETRQQATQRSDQPEAGGADSSAGPPPRRAP